jgi:hypothetical protein
VEVTRGTMSVAEGPAAGDGGLGPTAGGGLKLASVPVTTRLRQGGADAMGGGRLQRAAAPMATGASTGLMGGWLQSSGY